MHNLSQYGRIEKYPLSYTLNSVELQFYVTHLILGCPRDGGLTLSLTHGLSMDPEMYFPAIRYLRDLVSRSNLGKRINSVWFIQHPNHGDSGVLNEHILKAHFSQLFSLDHYVAAIMTFFDSGLVDHQDPNFVPVAHCVGASAMIFTCQKMWQRKRPFHRLIVMEPILLDRGVEQESIEVSKRNRKANLKRIERWRNLNEAVQYHTSKHPHKSWDPEVLDIFSKMTFRPLPNGEVTLKTTIEQENACFEWEYPLRAGEVLVELLPLMPIHIILAERQDLWTKSLYTYMGNIIKTIKPTLASYATVSKAGHYVVQDNPRASAVALMEALQVEFGSRPEHDRVTSKL